MPQCADHVIQIVTPNTENIIPLNTETIKELFDEPTTYMQLRADLSERYLKVGKFTVPYCRGLIFDLLKIGVICEAEINTYRNQGDFQLIGYMEIEKFHNDREKCRQERVGEEVEAITPMKVKVKVK